MGHTKIPSAPADFSSWMTSQNLSLWITVCTELQPSCAKGNTVGLLIPGNRAIISSSFPLGAFRSTYLDCLARNTDWILNLNLSRSRVLSSDIFGDTAKTASLVNISFTYFGLFLNVVLPLDTMSHIASAKPILGAISTEPVMIWSSACMPLLFR